MVGTYFGINGKKIYIPIHSSKFRVIWPSILVIRRVATTSLREVCLGKTLRRTRVNFVLRLVYVPFNILVFFSISIDCKTIPTVFSPFFTLHNWLSYYISYMTLRNIVTNLSGYSRFSKSAQSMFVSHIRSNIAFFQRKVKSMPLAKTMWQYHLSTILVTLEAALSAEHYWRSL